jgi:type II secretory ATPase GspE/PulE/Tfp pilus assembly ATPase PilB-like protein
MPSVIAKIQATMDLDQMFLDLNRDLLKAVDAQQVILYAVDPEKNELLTRFPLDTIQVIHVPIDEQSLAGFAALSGRTLTVRDVYNPSELRVIHPALVHDPEWDKKTGLRTKQVLTYPILSEGRTLLGVIQLLNKKSGDAFSPQDEAGVAELGAYVGAAFMRLRKQPKKFITFVEYLSTSKLLAPAEMEVLRAECRKGTVDLETILIDKLKVPKAALAKALGDYHQCPHFAFDDRLLPEAALLKNLKPDFLKRNVWVPLRRDGTNGIHVVVDNPADLDKVQNIKRLFPDLAVHLLVGLRRDILQFLEKAIHEGEPAGNAGIQGILGELISEAQSEQDDLTISGLNENDSAVVRLTHQIIAEAYRLGASDIHIEPYSETEDTEVRFRVDGSCFEFMRIPATYRRAVVSRIKIMSGMDIAERRKPQDGKIKFRLPDKKQIELRVATLPTAGRNNEDVVMRILTTSAPLPLTKMSFSDRNLQKLMEICEKPYGIILCVGPTGSGKTTTLHAVLTHINTPDRKIWTAEDPVEITQHGLRQVQVNSKIGFTFAAAMRSFLRADPDVIMIGEMRDKETADIAIEASLTGHLVFSTLHTNSAVETVVRLLDMGCDSFAFADALLGILAQRLCKRICSDCKEAYLPNQEEYDDLVVSYGAEPWAKLEVPYNADFRLYRGKGCTSCNHSGFKGRLAIHELLAGSLGLKRLIQTSAKTEEIFNIAVDEGMTTLVQDGIKKVLQGFTTYKQVRAVAIK